MARFQHQASRAVVLAVCLLREALYQPGKLLSSKRRHSCGFPWLLCSDNPDSVLLAAGLGALCDARVVSCAQRRLVVAASLLKRLPLQDGHSCLLHAAAHLRSQCPTPTPAPSSSSSGRCLAGPRRRRSRPPAPRKLASLPPLAITARQATHLRLGSRPRQTGAVQPPQLVPMYDSSHLPTSATALAPLLTPCALQPWCMLTCPLETVSHAIANIEGQLSQRSN